MKKRDSFNRFTGNVDESLRYELEVVLEEPLVLSGAWIWQCIDQCKSCGMRHRIYDFSDDPRRVTNGKEYTCKNAIVCFVDKYPARTIELMVKEKFRRICDGTES